MKTRVFEVKKKLIREFAGIMDDHNLENRIQGVNEDGEIEVAVQYEPEQKEAIEEIDQLLYGEDDEDEE